MKVSNISLALAPLAVERRTITTAFHPQGKKTEAERYFLKAIQLDPAKGNCYMHYGECASEKKKKKIATRSDLTFWRWDAFSQKPELPRVAVIGRARPPARGCRRKPTRVQDGFLSLSSFNWAETWNVTVLASVLFHLAGKKKPRGFGSRRPRRDVITRLLLNPGFKKNSLLSHWLLWFYSTLCQPFNVHLH